jgi:gas vesicle protein
MKKINVAVGAIAGVAVGTLLGVLIAPDKGTETRKKISTKSKDAADSIKNKFVDVINRNGSKEKAPQMQDQGEIN